ncbi:hypothetical protein O6H91_10G037100 [Diphasiastrum complanatum]|uniref:Uncharacterized protein n=1 Tax=Diphasiastrum complanatum TaxID=34168 RepID=A0ACC2CG29_DIPCM|nr:hypothetical protein O6H91_10G037100 [Diphasiastrum complanatum]
MYDRLLKTMNRGDVKDYELYIQYGKEFIQTVVATWGETHVIHYMVCAISCLNNLHENITLLHITYIVLFLAAHPLCTRPMVSMNLWITSHMEHARYGKESLHDQSHMVEVLGKVMHSLNILYDPIGGPFIGLQNINLHLNLVCHLLYEHPI